MTPNPAQRKQHTKFEGSLRGRRHADAAPNSMKFLVEVEGVQDFDGHIRGANGIRWRVAR